MFFPAPCTDRGVAHTVRSIATHLRDAELETELLVPRVLGSARASFIRAVLPRSIRPLPYALLARRAPARLEHALLEALEPGDAAYLWSQVSLRTTRTIAERGIPIIREKVNGHTAEAKRILDEAYERFGIDPKHHGITDDLIAKEREELALATIVSSPSPHVTSSLELGGVEAERIVQTSYGWDPARFAGKDRLIEPDGRVTVLFAGTACVRKGAHLLLEAWAKAGIDGRLILCGNADRLIRQRCGVHLDRRDVHVLGDVVHMGSVYRSCDFIVFPTLEEGSPLVTYEAMGHGIPILTSPIGAGDIVRHEREGIVCEPYDRDGLIAAMRRLAKDRELRESLGRSARQRADEFTWDKVGARRREAFLNHLSRERTRARDGALESCPPLLAA
jgi:glycosyltransferase involved in cell wall biosynthesis